MSIRRKARRRAAAVVELAVCLPVIVLLVFASLEGANKLFVRQAAVQAAYEAAKEASRFNGTNASARQLATEILQARRINNPRITFTPANVANAAAGTDISVTIRVAGSERSVTGIGSFSGRNIQVQATMLKE